MKAARGVGHCKGSKHGKFEVMGVGMGKMDRRLSEVQITLFFSELQSTSDLPAIRTAIQENLSCRLGDAR